MIADPLPEPTERDHWDSLVDDLATARRALYELMTSATRSTDLDMANIKLYKVRTIAGAALEAIT